MVRKRLISSSIPLCSSSREPRSTPHIVSHQCECEYHLACQEMETNIGFASTRFAGNKKERRPDLIVSYLEPYRNRERMLPFAGWFAKFELRLNSSVVTGPVISWRIRGSNLNKSHNFIFFAF